MARPKPNSSHPRASRPGRSRRSGQEREEWGEERTERHLEPEPSQEVLSADSLILEDEEELLEAFPPPQAEAAEAEATEAEGAPLEEGDAPQPAAEGEEDIYGEDDYPPEEEPYPQSRSRTDTQVAPAELEEDEEEEGADEGEETRAGPPVRVKVTEGPDAGRSRRFRGVRMVIGRGVACELVLSDPAVSRRHLELVRGEQGFLLRDLESDNGTWVNGAKVSEHLLQHEDQIALGKTKLLFRDEASAYRKLREAEARAAEEEKARQEAEEASAREEAEEPSGPEAPSGTEQGEEAAPEAPVEESPGAPAPAPRQTPRSSWPLGLWKKLGFRQKLLALAGAAGVLLLLAVVVAALARKPKVSPADLALAQAQEKLQLARNAMHAERFEEAVQRLKEAQELRPGIDQEGLLPRATEELTAQKALDLARSLIEHGELAKARAELQRFLPASTRRGDQKAALLKELERREREQLAGQLNQALSAGALAEARRLAALLPPEETLKFRARLDELEARATSEARAAAEEQARLQAEREQRLQEERQAEMETAFASVSRKFFAAEYQRAALECDRVLDEHRSDQEIRARAKLLKQLIPNFARNFEEGQRKFQANQLAAAVRPLRKARELYEQIGFTGPWGIQLDEELAAAALWAGREALARDDLSTALFNYREAARLDPGNPQAREGVEKVEGKAEELYVQAYQIRDRDPREAIALLKVVLEVTRPGSPPHQKAQAQLQALLPP